MTEGISSISRCHNGFYKDKDRMEVNSNSFFIYMQQQSLSLLSIDFQHTINNFYYY